MFDEIPPYRCAGGLKEKLDLRSGSHAIDPREGAGGARLYWLFNVKFNNISVIYVKAHRCAGGLKEKLDLRSGSHAIDPLP